MTRVSAPEKSVNKNFRRKDKSCLKTSRNAHAVIGDEKALSMGFLLRGKNTCSTGTTCSMLAKACSSGKVQKQETAASTTQAEVRSILRSSLQSTQPQREDRPHLLCRPLRPRPSGTTNEKISRSSSSKFSPPTYEYSPMSTLDADRLGILSSSYLHKPPGRQSQLHSNDQVSTVNKAS